MQVENDNDLAYALNLNLKIKHSHDVPLQGLGHRFVVTTSDPSHQVLVKVSNDAINSVNRGCQLLLLLLRYVQYAIGVPAPFSLDDVPDSFDRVQLTALRWQELVVKPWVVELPRNNPAVMDGEVVHDNNSLLEGVDQLELLDEG